MITAETVNGIVRFQANGLPVVSLYCRVDPGTSQREVRARVDSLLGQIRPLAKDRDLDHRPTDAAERSALIEAAEEQEALIDQLEARREALLGS